MKRFALLVLLACSPAMADKFSDGEKLAKADLAATVTTAKLAGTWQLGPLYWDSVQKRTVGEARLLFAVDASDKLADAPFVASDKAVIDLGPPAKMVVVTPAVRPNEFSPFDLGNDNEVLLRSPIMWMSSIIIPTSSSRVKEATPPRSTNFASRRGTRA